MTTQMTPRGGRQSVPTKQELGTAATGKPPWTIEEIAEHTSTYSAARFAPRNERDLEALADRWYVSGLLPAAYYAPRTGKDDRGVEREIKYSEDDRKWHRRRGVSMAVIVMRFGAALGVLPEIAIRSIYVIEGQPSPSAQLAAGIVLASKLCMDFTVIESTTKGCKIRVHRKGMPDPVIVEATYDEFRHLHRKTNWMNYPTDMVYARCVGRACRRIWPDLFAGVYLAEERVDVRDDITIADVLAATDAMPPPDVRPPEATPAEPEKSGARPAADEVAPLSADELKKLDAVQRDTVGTPITAPEKARQFLFALRNTPGWTADRIELAVAEAQHRLADAEEEARNLGGDDE